LSPKATKVGEITQSNRYYAVQGRSLKVTDFGTNRKPVFDFLVVNNNNNLHAISHRFQVMADYGSNFQFRQGCLSLTPSFGVIP